MKARYEIVAASYAVSDKKRGVAVVGIDCPSNNELLAEVVKREYKRRQLVPHLDKDDRIDITDVAHTGYYAQIHGVIYLH